MSRKLLKFTSIVGSMTLLSRISGLIRDVVFAHAIGAGQLADAFFVAFRIPNFFRRIFGEGAFSVAFVPVFTEMRAHHPSHDTQVFLDQMAGRLGLVLLAVSTLGVFGAPLIVSILAPGFTDEPEKYKLTVDALRLTFPYLFFISLVAMSAGILNTCNRFAVPAATPVLLNLCLIASVFLFIPIMPNATVALSLGVLVAGVVQLAVQFPFLHKEKLLPKPRLRAKLPDDETGLEGVGKVYRLMLPAIFGTSVAQVNLLINTVIASFLVTGSVSWLYYSDRLMEFPLGVFGIALATAILPDLSNKHTTDNPEEFSKTLDWALRWVFLVSAPATAGLISLAGPLSVTIFQHGTFTEHHAVMAAKSLIAFSVGVIALSAIRVLANGFYARQNTKTPVRIGIIAMIVNVIAGVLFVFVFDLGHVGLALATTVAAFVNSSLLFARLRREGAYKPQSGWWKFLAQVMAASVLMGVILWWGAGAIESWFVNSIFERIGRLAFWVTTGFGIYVLCILVFGIRPKHLIKN